MNLFPLLKDCETIPWWAGIAYKNYDTHTYRLAPIPINWIIAWAMVVHTFLRRPSVAVGILLKQEDVSRLAKVQLENYRLKIDLGDARVEAHMEKAARITAEMERDRLKVALETALREHLTTRARANHQEARRNAAQEYGP